MKGGGAKRNGNGNGSGNGNGNGNGVDEIQPHPQAVGAAPLELAVNGGEGEQTLVPPFPKLGEDFFEIETIRRKRVRKGQLQYLIKWRGWPETANTWEPLENLQSVPDVIDAFEDSLQSGKHGKRTKRRRKHVANNTQPKKRQQRSAASYSLRHLATDNHPQSELNDIPAHPQTITFVDGGETHGDATALGKPKQPNQNGFSISSFPIVERNEENGYDPKLSELKATANNGADADKLTINCQQDKASTDNGHMDGQSKVDCMEPVQSGRCKGAKRRKSGAVKRFRKEMYACEPVDTQNTISMSVGTVEPGWTGAPANPGNNGHKLDDARTACNIVKILRPVRYAASFSNNIEDVSLTLLARRSDGAEVMVDNKYLKAHNPLLLINFYEEHLRYNPTS